MNRNRLTLSFYEQEAINIKQLNKHDAIKLQIRLYFTAIKTQFYHILNARKYDQFYSAFGWSISCMINNAVSLFNVNIIIIANNPTIDIIIILFTDMLLLC